MMFFVALLTKLPTSFAAACAKPSFFFLPPWYEYLKLDSAHDCVPDLDINGFPHNILPIGLAVLDMLLRLAGFIAVISIIAAGVEYVFATGNAEKASNARHRIYNSLIGLAIALVATAAVTFVGKTIAK